MMGQARQGIAEFMRAGGILDTTDRGLVIQSGLARKSVCNLDGARSVDSFWPLNGLGSSP